MATGAPHYCPGRCGMLIPKGVRRCDPCRAKAGATDRRLSGTAHERGYDSRWQKRRALFLQTHPLCVECAKDTRLMPVAATVVDHIIPHKGNRALFDDEANWQPLCIPHHNAKTAREDMGAWRPVR